MQSKAATVEQYLASLPEDRRAAISAVRKVFLDNIDKGFTEGMQYGMMGYSVPHSIYPAGYHCDPRQPLPFAGMASQKNHMSVYLSCIYNAEGEARKFREDWARTGKKLDMGKSCIRFKKLDDLALNVIADTLRRTTVKKFIETYEAALGTMHKAKAARPGKSAPARKPAKAKATPGKKKAAKKSAKKSARR